MTEEQAARAATIEQLELEHRRRAAEFLERHRRYEACMQAMNEALQAYVDAVTAPMRAFAQQLREELERCPSKKR